MKYKKYRYWLLFLLAISCIANAKTVDDKNLATITVYSSKPDMPIGRVRLEITANTIIKYANLICNKKENITYCSPQGEDAQYIGHHDIFNSIPEKFLLNSNYYDMPRYKRYSYKIEFCFTDNKCNVWSSNTRERKDKDVDLFLTKIEEILAGKSEYEFKPILAK